MGDFDDLERGIHPGQKLSLRLLRKVAEGRPDELGDVSTLADPSVVEAIREGARRTP